MKRNRILTVSLCMLVLAGCQSATAEDPIGTESTSETARVVTEIPNTEAPEKTELDVEAIAMPSLEEAYANLPGDFILTAEASYPPGKFWPEIAEKAELIIRGRVAEVGESFMVERAGRPGTLMTVEVLRWWFFLP